MGLEEKVKDSFLNRIRSSLVSKIASYSLATALTFGVGLSCGGNGSSQNQDSNVKDKGVISGMVVKDTGTELVGVIDSKVTIQENGLYDITNSNGVFEIENVRPGTYSLLAEKDEDGDGDNELKVKQSNVSLCDGCISIDVGKIKLDQIGAISGRALKDGLPTGNLGIDVFVPGTSYIAKTDDNGYYTIAWVHKGIHTVASTYYGCVPAQIEGIEVLPAKTTTIVDLILSCDGTSCIDDDLDGFYSATDCGTPIDCNGGNNTIYPNAPEICDSIDNQCPGDIGYGTIDEGCVTLQCSDGIDNDGDGYIDLADFGCTDINDDNEINNGITQCSDGLDNDLDTFIDQVDSDCTNNLDNSESGLLSKIAFQSNRDGNYEVYVMNSDGSNQTNLTNNPAYDRYLALSSDGTKIAFQSDRDGNAEVYVMNSDGSNQIRLTNNSAWDVSPAWSPDGSKIAFQSNREGGSYKIYVMNSDGSNQIRLTNNLLADEHPAWSPDGSKIAFQSNRDGNYEVYVMNSDGSNQIRLTNNSTYNFYPAWSPDGNYIVFTSLRNDLDGICNTGSGTMDCNSDIYIMNSDGSNQIRLTNNSIMDSYPAWSPDGNYIAFFSRRNGNDEIYVMNSDGSNQTNLTNNPAYDREPSWSP